jgi:hypothetical protein
VETSSFQENVLPILYGYVVPSEAIPTDVLYENKELRNIAQRGGVCFARIERQIDWDLFRIRIAADPSRLDDDERSHLLFVSSVELRTMMESFQISAAIIPEALLNEDSALGQIARQGGACFARIERQIDWDLYAIRIAAGLGFLNSTERSYRIYATLAELQSHARATQAQQVNITPPPPINPPAPVRRKDVEFRALEAITISEEEIRKAEETMVPLKEYPLVHRHRPGSKFLRLLRQWIDLVLFRAVLATLEYQKDLQESVRQALVSRHQSGKRLINIQDMYEKDHRTYWSIQVYVPVSCI